MSHRSVYGDQEKPSKSAPLSPSALPLQTQKAKGIHALKTWGLTRVSYDTVKQARIYPHEPRPEFPFFGRPCPLVPRHGFVESRLIESEAQWTAMLAEIEATGEPHTEVVCMPFITPLFSGVLTPGLLSFGPGLMWVRDMYCKDAVETASQITYLKTVVGIRTTETATRDWGTWSSKGTYDDDVKRPRMSWTK